MEDKYIGKELEQKCGDILIVQKRIKGSKYEGTFKKYPYTLTFDIYNALASKVNNPQIEIEEFVKKEWLQNCGDSIRVIKKTESGKWLCEFIKYPYQFVTEKWIVQKGQILNPQIEQVEFFGKLWKQKCGDSVKIIKKVESINKVAYYKVEFVDTHYKTKATKSSIKSGTIENPLLEDFIGHVFLQKCGDSLKVLEKTNKQVSEKSNYLYKCKFQSYPYVCYATKGHILTGCVANPQIEQVEFINKVWPQNCGDVLKIVKKSTNRRNNKEFLWKCEFINYPYKIEACKSVILAGQVDNPKLPYKNKDELIKYIKNNFKTKKPTIVELAQKMGFSRQRIGRAINEFNLRTYINYYENHEEASLRNFVSQFVEVYPEEYYISDKEGKYYGIDVYIPSKKIGFEFNGTYWHSELFKDSQYHQKKSLVAAEKGIQLFHIWEHEWNDPVQRPIIEALIKSKLGKFSHKIGASKCQIVDLSYKKYADFCNENHIQGEAGAKVKLGLTYQGKLIK